MRPGVAALVATAAVGTILLAATAAAAAGLAFGDPRLQAQTPLVVSLPGVAAVGGPLPRNYARDGRNVSPALSWTAGPAGVKGYVLIVQDADGEAKGARGDGAAEPYVHWLAYDISPQTTMLARGVKNMAAPTRPLGVEQGRNSHGSFGYTGPDVAQGEAPHHYHFQVFALDQALRTAPGADLSTLERDMAGHVIASGELVATYAPPPPPRAPGDTNKLARDKRPDR